VESQTWKRQPGQVCGDPTNPLSGLTACTSSCAATLAWSAPLHDCRNSVATPIDGWPSVDPPAGPPTPQMFPVFTWSMKTRYLVVAASGWLCNWPQTCAKTWCASVAETLTPGSCMTWRSSCTPQGAAYTSNRGARDGSSRC